MSVKVLDLRPNSLDYAAHKELYGREDIPERSFSLGKHTTLPMRNQDISNNCFERLGSGQFIRKKFTNNPEEHESDIVPIIEKHNENYNTRDTKGLSYRGHKKWIPTSTTHTGTKVQKVSGSSIIELANNIKPKKEIDNLPRRKQLVEIIEVNGVRHTIIKSKRYS